MQRIPAALCVLILLACGRGGESLAVEAVLRSATNLELGQAGLTETPDWVEALVVAQGLTPGRHGVHLHETGRCEAPDFESAGAHLNPGSRQHGRENPAGAHLGDLGNLEADAQGRGNLTVRLDRAGARSLDSLLAGDGLALILHADPDDQRSDPGGNAGARLACAELHR